MKKASLIGLVLFCIMAGQAVGDDWWWPPTGGAMVTPQNPIRGDIVAITLSGEWPHSCIPNDSAILMMGHRIHFDVILDYPPGACLIVITPWERTESVGPLPPRTYTVYARLIGDPLIPERYVPMAAFTVARVSYVDANAPPGGNGQTWATAYKYLQDALAAAGSGSEIWVADGTYEPDANSADPNGSGKQGATFELINGVAIKGGYAGTGAGDPNARDIELYETILSGDLDGNDVDVNDPRDLLGEPTRNENSYHVVRGSGTNETAVLDGFSIRGGNLGTNGGGIYCSGGSPTIINCTISGNCGRRGGGLYGCDGPIRRCIISGNLATYRGGGLYGCSGPISDCVIIRNVSRDLAGGLYGCDGPITNCTISYNLAQRDTGGLCACAGPIVGCRISNNVAQRQDTGGLGICGPVINCVITGNLAGRDAGALGWGFGPLINCVVSGNSAGRNGGALRGYEGDIINCTITGNVAGGRGGAMHLCYGVISNCIMYGNRSGDSSIVSSSSLPLYCCLQEDSNGVGCITSDPCFVQPGYWDVNGVWVGGDYHLLAGSRCIDAGDNNSIPADTADLNGDGNTAEPIPWDLDGNPRIVDGNNDGKSVVDMGAYEYFVPPMEVPMKFTPQALNPGSKGKWVKAHFVLPEEYTVEDVDVNAPAVVEPGGIESDYINVFINEDGLVEVEAAFGRSEFCAAGIDGSEVEVTVTGSLTSGQHFYGTDAIKVTKNIFGYLAVLASHWLEADCGKPDWCEGADLDQDSVVNFVDFVLFDGCCIEVIGE